MIINLSDTIYHDLWINLRNNVETNLKDNLCFGLYNGLQNDLEQSLMNNIWENLDIHVYNSLRFEPEYNNKRLKWSLKDF